MIIYPAIDLIDGQCVRLYKGDFDQQTIYDSSPIEVAQSYAKDGAQWLHLVDLDGAKDPEKRQLALIREIIAQSGLKVQTGGGLRSADDVAALLDAGASRVVVGSLAVKDWKQVLEMFERFGPDKICLAADVVPQDGTYMIAVSGWQEESTLSLDMFLQSYVDAGLVHVLCTDISRDGTMGGCNTDLYTDLVARYPGLQVQASGGVSSLDDIKALKSSGVIIGKALYEGAFTLKEALSC
jgi:phosphoribosylformimino-5-aminoimidazole carboxamide ribotide isomerase